MGLEDEGDGCGSVCGLVRIQLKLSVGRGVREWGFNYVEVQ